MATSSNSSGESPRKAGRVVSRRNKVAAARLRVEVDKKRGVVTPKWIREIAESKAS